ncbi:hypothetical protein IJ095_00545, partial [Candidatus Saccharibacteria bacterium]|nr:hypothetical protein [Candidatus Saccharibacteria bacterium]
MQDKKKSLIVRKGALGEFIDYCITSSDSSHRAVRKSFYCSLSCLAIFLLSLVFVPYAALHASASQYADATVRWGSVSLTLDPDYAATQAGTSEIGDEGHGDIDFGDIVPTENNLADFGSSYGTLKVVKRTIGITSSGKYYTVYLSTSSANNNLNLELTDGSYNTGINIPAVTADFSTPVTFTDSSWGYAVPGVQNTGITGAPSTFVVPSLLDTQIGSQTSIDGAVATYTTTKWAPVPGNTTPQQIWKAEAQGQAGTNYGFGTYINDQSVQVTGDTTNNHFDVYFAVAVDTDVLAGTYSNHVVYTALASASSLDSVSKNLMNDLAIGGGGDVQTIRFDLAQSVTTITESDLTITLVPHSVMVAQNYSSNTFEITDLGDMDSAGYINCPIVSGSLTVDTYAEVQCVMPHHLAEAGDGAGTYDFWVNIDGYNFNYISHATYNSTDIGAFVYAGLQSEYPSSDARYSSAANANNHIVKEMQQMTTGICNNTNAWSDQTGPNARVYNYTGTGEQLVSDTTTTTTTTDPDTGEEVTTTSVDAATTVKDNLAIGTGTFALIDSRDGNDYLVRRLADGNCWMVQNLDLDLSTVGTLTSADSDVSSDWDPYESSGSSNTDATVFLAYSLQQLGSAQPTQYQNSAQYGTQGNYKWHWGSRYDENDNIIAGTTTAECQANTTSTLSDGTTANTTATYDANQGGCVENNSRAAIPRSYDNTVYSEDIAAGGLVRNTVSAVNYVMTNGLTGGTSTTVGTTSTRTSTTWDAANNTFYGNEYIGKYYNWYATTAETGLYNMSESISVSHADDQAADSICPKGWNLPYDAAYTAGANQSWSNLLFTNYYKMDGSGKLGNNSDSSLALRSAPLSIPYTGRYNWANANLDNRGSAGFFWSRTANSQPNARYLFFYGSSVSPQDSYQKVYGFTVRCVAAGDSSSIPDSQVASTCAAGKICYGANGGSGTMADQSASANSSVVLTAPTFLRTGYSFAGWSTQENGFGTVYGPNETITTPSTLGTTGLQLYAKWLPSTGTMQTWAGCSELGEHKSIALTDTRDGNTYTVTKLKDGNCWMTENLRLDLANFAGSTNLNTQNTDLSNTTNDSALQLCQDGDSCYEAGGTNYYWDPSASTEAKIALYDTELTNLGLSKDFTGLSELLLGQAQPAQFQSSGQTVYWWGSIYNNDWEVLDGTNRSGQYSG